MSTIPSLYAFVDNSHSSSYKYTNICRLYEIIISYRLLSFSSQEVVRMIIFVRCLIKYVQRVKFYEVDPLRVRKDLAAILNGGWRLSTV